MWPPEPTDVDRAAFLVARFCRAVRDEIGRDVIERTVGAPIPNTGWSDYRRWQRWANDDIARKLREHEAQACDEYGLDPLRWRIATKTAIRDGRNLWLWADSCLDELLSDPATLTDEARVRAAINLVYPAQFSRTRETRAALHGVYDAFLRNEARASAATGAGAANADAPREI